MPHRRWLGGIRGLEQDSLSIAHQRGIDLAAKHGIGKMGGAGIGGGEVVKRLAIVGTGVLKGVGELEVLRRHSDAASGNGGDGIGGDLLIADHLLHATLNEGAHGSFHLVLVECKSLLQVPIERSSTIAS